MRDQPGGRIGIHGKKYYRNTFKIENLKKAGSSAYKFYLQEVKNTEDSGKEENATRAN